MSSFLCAIVVVTVGVQGNRLSLFKRLADKFPSFRSTVNTADLQGRTPLIWASMKGYLEMAGTLIDYGASLTTTDQYGKDAQVRQRTLVRAA